MGGEDGAVGGAGGCLGAVLVWGYIARGHSRAHARHFVADGVWWLDWFANVVLPRPETSLRRRRVVHPRLQISSAHNEPHSRERTGINEETSARIGSLRRNKPSAVHQRTRSAILRLRTAGLEVPRPPRAP